MKAIEPKIIHLCSTDTGGAGKAALRLCLAQRQAGMDARLLVAVKGGHSPAVEVFYPRPGLIPRFQREVRWRAMRGKARIVKDDGTRSGYPFSPEGSPYRKDLVKALVGADIIHLHWMARFLHLPLLNDAALKDKRFVWTLHDFHPVTGGCHYPAECGHYMSGCGHCPLLREKRAVDLSTAGWHLRREVFAKIGKRISIVAPSRWLVRKAQGSGVLAGQKVELLRNTLDLNCFKPRDRIDCRKMLDLPIDRPLVLFVSDRPNDLRKGGDLIESILRGIRAGVNAHFVSVGDDNAFPEIPDHSSLGMIADDRLLAMIYAAADVFLLPSRDDNLPNTVIESLACGTPVVCFDTGGAPELVETGISGAVVPIGNPSAMADEAIKIIKQNNALVTRHSCRAKAESEIEAGSVTKKSREIYHSLSNDSQPQKS